MIEHLESLITKRPKTFVIGLTGQTGSGCTATANIISKLNLEKEIPKPEKSLENLEDRKYSIVYRYYTEKILDNIDFITINYVSYINRRIKSPDLNVNDFKKFIEKNKKNIPTWNNNLLNDIGDAFKIEDINEFGERIKNILLKHSIRFSNDTDKDRNEAKLYTYLYQKMGANLRQTNNPFDGKIDNYEELEDNEFLRYISNALNKQENDKNRYKIFILDSIKNPFEAIYFKKNVKNFYLFSVRSDKSLRHKNLKSIGYKYQEIVDIDLIEFPKKDLTKSNFGRQDLDKCIDLADIHLVNSGISLDYEHNIASNKEYKKQILKYLSLIINPGIINPSEEEKCMQIAYSAKANSGCISRKVGAVLTDENYDIKSIGWNSTPRSLVPCLLRNLDNITNGNSNDNSFSNFECKDINYSNYLKSIYIFNIKNYNNNNVCLPYCFRQFYNMYKGEKNQVHTRAIHAEEMAFLHSNIQTGKNLILFTTSSPCELCAKKAVHLGVSKIYYITSYPGISTDHILSSSENTKLELFSGAVGPTFHEIYSPLVPLKDSINYQKEIYKKENFNIISGIQIKTYENKYLLKLSEEKELLEDNDESPSYGQLTKTNNNDISGTLFNIEFLNQKFCISTDIKNDTNIQYIIDGFRDKNIDLHKKCPNCGYKNQDNKENPNKCIICGYSKTKTNFSKVYLSITPNYNYKAICNRFHKYMWEKFEIEFVNDGHIENDDNEIQQVVHIKSLTNDKYLSFVNDCVIANKDNVTINDLNSKFILVKKL